MKYSSVVSRYFRYCDPSSSSSSSRGIDFKSFSSQNLLEYNGVDNINEDDNQNGEIIRAKQPYKNMPRRGKHKRDHITSPRKVISTEWVQVTNVSHLSTLDDLLPDIERIMTFELSMGIVDLDAAEKLMQNKDPDMIASDISPQLPLWEPHSSLLPHLVVEARVKLSTLKRLQGWYLKFPNRSVVHALMSHLDEARRIEAQNTREKWKKIKENKSRRKSSNTGTNFDDDDSTEPEEEEDVRNIPEVSESRMQIRPLMCAWQEVQVFPFYLDAKSGRPLDDSADSFMDGLNYMIGDNVLRVENCSRETTVDDVKYFFRRFKLCDDRRTKHNEPNLRSVELIVKGEKTVPKNLTGITPSMTNSFLVRFASSADARAAMTEKQHVELLGRRIRMARYSRQTLDDCYK